MSLENGENGRKPSQFDLFGQSDFRKENNYHEEQHPLCIVQVIFMELAVVLSAINQFGSKFIRKRKEQKKELGSNLLYKTRGTHAIVSQAQQD